MALHRFLRRAAPSLLRSFSASASASAAAAATRPLLVGGNASGSWSRRLFSSSGVAANKLPTPSDASLLRVLEAEIKCAEECDDQDRVEAVPEDFPFEIEDDKGTNVVRLRRTYQGKEHIEVTVAMPSLVTGEEEVEEEEEDGAQTQSNIPLTVRVSKDDGAPTLEFVCTAYPDEVVIDSMSVIERGSHGGDGEGEREEHAGDVDMLAYEGPNFNDLDENLQKAFHKYLELRGITPLNTNFLHEYMINKDSREYLLWLRNLKAFLLK